MLKVMFWKGLDLALASSRSGLGRKNERLGLMEMCKVLFLVSSQTENKVIICITANECV